MQASPTAPELIDAVAECLRGELLPALSGRAAFQARVAAGVLDIVRRELRDGPAAEAAGRTRLAALAGGPATGDRAAAAPGDAASAVAMPDTATLRRDLAEAIRTGRIDTTRDDLLEHLWADVMARLAIDQPTYPSYVAELRGEQGRD